MKQIKHLNPEILEIAKNNTISYFDTDIYINYTLPNFFEMKNGISNLYFNYTNHIFKFLNIYGNPIRLLVPANTTRPTSKTILQFSDTYKDEKFNYIPIKAFPIEDFKNEEYSIIIQTKDNYYLVRFLNWGSHNV